MFGPGFTHVEENQVAGLFGAGVNAPTVPVLGL